MKIDNLTANQAALSRTDRSSGSGSGISFQDLLQGQLQAVESTSPSQGVSPVAPLPSLPPGLRLDGLSLTEQTIDTLDNFGAALANPSFTNQDLAPYADALEDESQALVSLKEQLPAGDPLAALLDRVATVSYVEVAKYRRGDYAS